MVRISIENSHRIVLLLFCVLDHAVWLYCGYWEQAALVYVIVSECVRIALFACLIYSFWKPAIVQNATLALLAYCACMLLPNFYAAHSYSMIYPDVLLPNILLFKRDAEIPIDHALIATAFYMYYFLFSYFFSAKYIHRYILKKS